MFFIEKFHRHAASFYCQPLSEDPLFFQIYEEIASSEIKMKPTSVQVKKLAGFIILLIITDLGTNFSVVAGSKSP